MCSCVFFPYFHHTDEDLVNKNSTPCSCWYCGYCEWDNSKFAFRSDRCCQMLNFWLTHLCRVMQKNIFLVFRSKNDTYCPLKPQKERSLPSFLVIIMSLVSFTITICFPEPRHLTGGRFNDCIYIHWVLIDLRSYAVSRFWITTININVITCQF